MLHRRAWYRRLFGYTVAQDMYWCSSLLTVSLTSVDMYWKVGLKFYEWVFGTQCLVVVIEVVTAGAKLNDGCLCVDDNGGM